MSGISSEPEELNDNCQDLNREKQDERTHQVNDNEELDQEDIGQNENSSIDCITAVEPTPNNFQDQFSYFYDSEPEEKLQAEHVGVSCITFLNIGIISNEYESSFDMAPFVIFGKVKSSQLPPAISFNKEVIQSDISRLIASRPVDYQRKTVKYDQRSDVDVGKVSHVWDPTSLPFGSKIHFTTNLSSEDEMDIVGREFDSWKGVQGTLVGLFPHLNKNSNVTFTFSEKASSGGIRMEAERFGSCNVLFQGRKEWFVLDPSANRSFINEMNSKYATDQCPFSFLHKQTFVGRKTRSRFPFVSFTQNESEVVVLPPGLIYQVRTSKNSVQANYNYTDDRWGRLTCDQIHDSCACATGGHLLTHDDILLLKEDINGRTLARLFGTAEGLELENYHTTPETSKFLNKLNQQRANTGTQATPSNVTSTALALFNRGNLESSLVSSIPYSNPNKVIKIGPIPNTKTLMALPDGSFGSSSTFFCTRCNQQFTDEQVCLAHIAGHDAKFPCNVCTRIFSTKHLLSRHQQSCVTPGPFPCEACGMAYDHQKNLDIHRKTLGACRYNPITCGCGKKFNRQAFGNHRNFCKRSREISKLLKRQTQGSESPEIKITEMPSTSRHAKESKRRYRQQSSESSLSSESSFTEEDSDYRPRKHKQKRKYKRGTSSDDYEEMRRRKSKKWRKSKKAKPKSSSGLSPIVDFPGSNAENTPRPCSSRHTIRHSYNLSRSPSIQPNDKGSPIDLSKTSVNDSEDSA